MGRMVDQPGFFDLSARLRELSTKGDDLERIAALGTSDSSARSWSGRCRVGTAARAAARPLITC
jgi:hypothetical protein